MVCQFHFDSAYIQVDDATLSVTAIILLHYFASELVSFGVSILANHAQICIIAFWLDNSWRQHIFVISVLECLVADGAALAEDLPGWGGLSTGLLA